MTATTVTPVTLLTGFLGSGKTTLLNRLLGHPAAGDCAVIVNEFGPVAIDHALVRTASENVVLLPSGCVCCQVAGDLVQAMRDLYFKRAAGEIPAFRRAIVETTGLADPAPLARTLIELPLVAARYSLSGIVTTVDGQHGMGQLDSHPEAVKQAAVADRLVITKADLARTGRARCPGGAARRAQPRRPAPAKRPRRRRPRAPARHGPLSGKRTSGGRGLVAQRRRLPARRRAAVRAPTIRA